MAKQKAYEELTFSDDFMFCKILQENEDLCKELLELILEKKVGDIIKSDKQKAIEITADGKGVRFDVYLEDDHKTIYDIEMQTSQGKNLPKRSRYYQGMIDLNLIRKGDDYNKLKKSYIIFICTFDEFGKGKHKYTFVNTCKEVPDLVLNDETVKLFLCAGGTENDVSDELRAFLLYVADHKTNSLFTNRLEKEVQKARQHDEWKEQYMTLLMKYREERAIGDARRLITDVKGIMDEFHVSLEKACSTVKSSVEEYEEALSLIESEDE